MGAQEAGESKGRIGGGSLQRTYGGGGELIRV